MDWMEREARAIKKADRKRYTKDAFGAIFIAALVAAMLILGFGSIPYPY